MYIGVKGVTVVNLLQYADDTIFFGKENTQNMLVIKSLMHCFKVASELKVNFRNKLLWRH